MRGRPKMKPEDKRKFRGISLTPSAAEKLEEVDGNVSAFINAVILKLPIQIIKKYNQAPDKFVATFEPFGVK